MMKTVLVWSWIISVSFAFPVYKKNIFSKHSVVERELTQERKDEARETFDKVDTNGDGSVTITEYTNYLLQFDNGPTSEERYRDLFLNKVLKYDKNKNGTLEYPELLEMLDDNN